MTIRDGISNSNHFWPFFKTNKFFKVGSKALKCQHTINGEKFSHEVISPLEKEEEKTHTTSLLFEWKIFGKNPTVKWKQKSVFDEFGFRQKFGELPSKYCF